MPEITTNSSRAWLLASRPKTLTGASVPVIIGMAQAFTFQGFINPIPAALCLLFALLMQIDANFVNDYFDWRRGNDDPETRLGPLRACSQGWVTPRAMVIAIVLTTAVACLVGLPLIYYGGLEMILVGAACVAFCVLYTTTFSYLGLGDLLVLVFFGLVPASITFYLLTGTITAQAVIVSLACGLAVDNLLIINNYRDFDNDRRDGKRTLIVFIGRTNGERLYLLLGIIAALSVAIVARFHALSALLLVYLAFHLQSYRQMKTLKDRELNRVLGQTARNIFLFGLLTSALFLCVK